MARFLTLLVFEAKLSLSPALPPPFIPGENCGTSTEIKDLSSMGLLNREAVLNVKCAFVSRVSHNLYFNLQPRWAFTSDWSGCDVTCGLGHMRRTRECHNGFSELLEAEKCGGGTLTLYQSCLVCPEGWEFLESAMRCYHFTDDLRLRVEELDVGHMTPWLGGNEIADPGTWVWASDGAPIGPTFWADNEPNNLLSEHCLQFKPSLLGWNDLSCGAKRRTVCEIGGDSQAIIVRLP